MKQTNYKIIEEFVDKSIEDLINPEWDFFYTEKENVIDESFIDKNKSEKENKIAWKAIKSLISDAEIRDFEKEVKVVLPNSFKYYLKYKNFYELGVISQIWMFCPLIPEKWKEKIIEQTFDGYPREYIYNKGLLPFAHYADWGLTCFNTNKQDENGEYEIVIWDHELPEERRFLADDLIKMFGEVLRNYQKMQEGDQ